MLTAAHNVMPICPRCGGAVRSGVQIAAEVADLRARLAAAPVDALAHHAVALLAEHFDAELTGYHLDCHHPLHATSLHLADTPSSPH